MAAFLRPLVACCCAFATLLTSHAGWAQESERSTTLPFQLQDNLIRVPITLNGHTASAVLDSGTGALALDRSFALSIGMKPGATIGDAPGGGGPSALYPISIDSLQFGPEHLANLNGVAIDLAQISRSAGFPVDVLLGQPVFAPQPLRIDYPRRQIKFLPADQPMTCADPVPFTMAGGSPAIAVTIRANPSGPSRVLHLVVDLGTRHSVAMIGGTFLAYPEAKDLIAHSHAQQVGTGTGGSMQGYFSEVSSLQIGSHTLLSPTVTLTSDLKLATLGIADGTLGVPAWIDGTVTFDYAHGLLCFTSPASPRIGKP